MIKAPHSIATDILERGWKPVLVPIGKSPKLKNWQHLDITAENLARYFNGAKINVGAIMGPRSNGLTDIDIDCPEALVLAPYFLPKTATIYGRLGKRRSHYLYVCNDPDPKAVIKLRDEDKRCIVELRLGGGGKGAQSVMPGSVHPSGELYEWDSDGKPATATCAELKAAITKIAVGVIFTRHWPKEGSRHDAALGVGGFLARVGWPAEEVGAFVAALCHAVGDKEGDDRKRAAFESAENFAQGEQVYGMPWLRKFFGKKVATTIATLLGYGADTLDPNRPLIQFKAGDLPFVVSRAEEILLAAREPIYQRGPLLVRPIVDELDASHGRKTKVARFVQMSDLYLCDVLGGLASWQRYDVRTDKWVNIDTPPKVASTLLAREGKWNFPVAAGVISTPTMRPDGSLLTEPGYDEATRLLLIAPPEIPVIPDKPTKKDALAKLKLLKELLVEFPFVDTVDLSVALSAMITPVVRGAFPVAPMHSANAPVAGSGKSYLWDLVAAIVLGQIMPVMAIGRSEEETEKRLGASIITGQPLISIDNVNGELKGDALCQLIERPVVDIRILGKTEKIRVEARGTSFFCTGNNLVIYGDLCRRVLTCSLDPRDERPELRQFKGNPVAKILTDRGTYIAAALTICRAYFVAGRPNKAPSLASFESWSDLVRSALMWLGEADPVQTIEAARRDDPELELLRSVLQAWSKVIGIGTLKCKKLQDVVAMSETKENSMSLEPKWPELTGAMEMIALHFPHLRSLDAAHLGLWAQRNKNRFVDGLRLVNKPNARGSLWWVEGKNPPAEENAKKRKGHRAGKPRNGSE
jgi:hypothetical protein